MPELRQNETHSLRSNYYLKAFFLGLGLSIAIFLPFLVVDGGRFLFYGDFNVQQVPFYRLAHDAVRAGEFGWNYKTDLGVNFIGSYSFYLLGSPFFWLTIPFPSQWVQYLMGPLLILKLGCASLTGYVYLHRYTRTRDAALVGALLYAFSGFSVYNIFFNHFHEAIITFPLLLTALDEYMLHRRRGLFALAVGFCCLVNYYFFVGQVTFTLVYFCIRLASGSWRIGVRDFFLLALEAVLGLGLSGVLLLPSVLAVVQNTRTGNFINGWNAVLYGKNQRYLHILECFFFPPDIPARPNFTPDSDAKWASLGAWLPLFGMSGVIGWLQLRRKHWLKKLLAVLFFMALVPGLNAAFQLFNSAYYARWFYTLTLMMSLATVLALENDGVDWKRAVAWTGAITLGIAAVVGFMPTVNTSEEGEKSVSFGLEQYPTRFWSYVAIALVSLAALCYVFLFCRDSFRRFYRSLDRALALIVVFYSIFFISLGKTQADYTWDHLIPYALNGGEQVALPGLQETRSDFYESLDNSAMFWEIPSIQAFHSIVPGSVMEFYESIGVQRDVASRPDTSHYALRGLTSVRWLFDDDHDDNYFAGEDGADPAMPGFAYYGNLNGFDVWENLYCIPMGFSYDCYLPRSEYDALSEKARERNLVRAVVLEDEDVAFCGDLLYKQPEKERLQSQQDYLEDCTARSQTACTQFAYTRTGFTATASPERDRLMFFSVPYESGWNATVNGQPADILRVNVGFMAVRVPAGEDVQIVFTYRTPGLSLGFALTILSGLLLGLYRMFNRQGFFPQKPPVRTALLRVGDFAQYQQSRGATFQRPNALRPKQERRPMAPEPDAPPPAGTPAEEAEIPEKEEQP